MRKKIIFGALLMVVFITVPSCIQAREDIAQTTEILTVDTVVPCQSLENDYNEHREKRSTWMFLYGNLLQSYNILLLIESALYMKWQRCLNQNGLSDANIEGIAESVECDCMSN